MKDLIYEKEEFITEELCEKIISLFNENTAEIKKDTYVDTLVLKNNILKCSNIWKNINTFIYKNLIENLSMYYEKIDELDDSYFLNLVHTKLSNNGFTILKYKKNGISNNKYEDDYFTDGKRYRILKFIIFLNDDYEDGDVAFINNFKIKPIKKKIVIYPVDWVYATKQNIPINNDKYILCGWIYNDF
jgi:hypothetical protein